MKSFEMEQPESLVIYFAVTFSRSLIMRGKKEKKKKKCLLTIIKRKEKNCDSLI